MKLLICIVLLLSNAVIAIDTIVTIDCSKIKDSLERLTCYDKSADYDVVEKPQKGWQLIDVFDEFRQKEILALTGVSDNNTVLTIFCYDHKKVKMEIDWNNPLYSEISTKALFKKGRDTIIQYNYDGRRVNNTRWKITQPNTSAIYIYKGRYKFLSVLANAKKTISFRTENLNQSATFNINGFKEKLKIIEEQCPNKYWNKYFD